METTKISNHKHVQSQVLSGARSPRCIYSVQKQRVQEPLPGKEYQILARYVCIHAFPVRS